MKTVLKALAAPFAVLAATGVFAQSYTPLQPSYQGEASQQAAYRPQAAFSQAELDQILAPIALYPDALLSQLLMASTYPRDVAEAARWSRANPRLQGDDAVRAVENEPWDPSVKSMVAFPQILSMMDEKLDWTERLGEAFLAREDAVMQTVQQLRQRADEAGNLRSNEHIAVQRDETHYVITSPSPEIVYVPYYDSRVVYGSWWWPDYQPVYWNAWPGYSYYSGISIGWGRGISLHRNFFYGGFDWGRRHVRYAAHRPYYFRGDHYWRGWRDDRRDGRHYTQGRSPGSRPGYDRRDNSYGGRQGYTQDGRSQYGDRGSYRPQPVDRANRPQTGERGRTRPNYENTGGNYAGRNNSGVRTAAPRYVNEAGTTSGVRNRVEAVGQPSRLAPVQGRVAQPAAGVREAASPARSVQRAPMQAGAPVQIQRPVPQVQHLSAPQVQQRAAPAPMQRSAPAPQPAAAALDRSRGSLQSAGSAGGGQKYRER